MLTVMTQQRKQNITDIVKAYGSRLFRFIRSKVPSTADAEDIAQEVWYQFSNVVDTEPIEQVSGWLFQVARNRITDNYRKKKEDALEDFAIEDEEGTFSLAELLLADLPDDEDDEPIRALFWEVLFEALQELPEDQRNVFVWNELESETLQEIADRTGINLKTLISRKRYAVQHLRKRLQPLYEELIVG